MSEETIREICRLRAKDLSVETISKLTNYSADEVEKVVGDNKELVAEYKDFDFQKEAE